MIFGGSLINSKDIFFSMNFFEEKKLLLDKIRERTVYSDLNIQWTALAFGIGSHTDISSCVISVYW